MTDAPERIWAGEATPSPEGLYGSWSLCKIGEYDSEYLRADLVPSWQPIETAPLGERLLAYHEHIDGFAVCVVVADSQGKRTTLLDWDMMVFNATHWMPLPEPPDAD